MIAIEPAPSDEPAFEPRQPAHRPRGAPLMLGIVCGLVATVVALMAVLYFSRSTTPRLTDDAFQRAVALWDSRGLQDYDLDIELSGSRPGKVHVEVRSGQVATMTRDGIEPRQKRTWYVWSVPGMFDTIEQELSNARDPAASFKSAAISQMVMWAEFDPEWGYPRQYDRVVLGADFEVHWKVTRFEPLAAKN